MINNGYLLGLFDSSLAGMNVGGASATTARRTQPTAPWAPAAKPSEASALVRAALAGRRLIDEAAPRIDLAGASSDYRKMFALYQGLETLTALAARAGARGVTASESALIAKRFAAGLGEVSAYLGANRLDGINLVQGMSKTSSATSAAVPRDNPTLITAAIHQGSPDAVVAAFQGPTAFTLSARLLDRTVDVAIDLDEMGDQPRSLNNVVAFMNGKLEAAGLQTRIGRQQVEGEPRTLTVGTKTITLPAREDQWALVVRGASTETLRFSAPANDSVQVIQATGKGAQVLKFDAAGNATAEKPGETFWVDGRVNQSGLPDGVEVVRASAAGPDGSMWLVADLSAGAANQPIKGQSDVALLKVDSSGRVVSTRLLGAAAQASGYAIAVSDDGRVAVAGSVIGGLDASQTGADARIADSFVTVFGADGAEQWTQRRGARAEDEATAVSFGENGQVFVAGRAKSAMPGAAALGGWDGYLQTFSETQIHSLAPIKGASTGVVQFGGAGDDSVQAMTRSGDDLYTAGVESGRLVVRRFTLDGDGRPQLSASRDLGPAGGSVAGLSVVDGRVVLAGSTTNPNLSAGQVNAAHSGGSDAFVAVLSGDLTASAEDRLTYFGGSGNDTVADMKIQDGKVWITGVHDRPIDAKAADPTRGYLARLDPLSGAVEWTRDWAGDGMKAAPSSLVVSSGGASVLDRLGLPQGEIAQSDSKRLVDATALRVGDRFQVQVGTRKTTITIEARDTLESLARKIEQASSLSLKVTLSSVRDGDRPIVSLDSPRMQQLTLTSRNGKSAILIPGEAGRDALAGLGLPSGHIGPASGDDGRKTFGLDLPSNLSLGTSESLKAAQDRLSAAMTTLRSAYRALNPANAATKAATGPAPEYITNQIANYKAALQRLGG